MPRSRQSWRRRARIWSWIVTSRAVVGSSASSSSGDRMIAAAMAIRWRSAAGKLVRESAGGEIGIRDPDQPHCLDHPLANVAACDPAEGAKSLTELLADCQHRVQGAERILKDHRHMAAPKRFDGADARPGDVGARYSDAAGGDRRVRVKKADDGAQHRALAATGLADEFEDLAARDREGNIGHRRGASFATVVDDRKSGDAERRRVVGPAVIAFISAIPRAAGDRQRRRRRAAHRCRRRRWQAPERSTATAPERGSCGLRRS